jgi:hypothetical protein
LLADVDLSQREVHPRVAIVDGQHDGRDPDVYERRIRDVIAQKRAKFFQDETLQSGVPVAGTTSIVTFTSHDTRLRGGSCAAQTGTRRERAGM